MPGTSAYIEDYLVEDDLARRISEYWIRWNNSRREWLADKKELRSYIFATDTTTTTNSKNDWSNKTTVPKLTQIRDNLYSNYMASMFPRRKWLRWEADNQEDQSKTKADTIRDYIMYIVEQPRFEQELGKLVTDYIDYGNCFAAPDWVDNRIERDFSLQTGYVGPVARRISPVDIVFNPTAPDFQSAPKIIRSFVGIGEVEDILKSMSHTEMDIENANFIQDYIVNLRRNVRNFQGDLNEKDSYYQMDGFDTFRSYLDGDYVELLTFYGDIYDLENEKFYKNYVITIVDRHKIAYMKPNESIFGTPPMYHSGWRVRQDNLWAMGPLDNLVGIQYRIDHIENMKADVLDLLAYPPIKITGDVEDFSWEPNEKIYVGDDGDIEMIAPDVGILQANIEIQNYENKMEEMAGAPKEAMGFRTPGEKTMYEVQRLENAASRIFQSKIAQFEKQILEPLLNAMLELAVRKMEETTVRVFDDEFKINIFRQITSGDLDGSGRIRPIAARHFAEKAEKFQNISQFFTNGPGTDPMVSTHFSSVKLAEVYEEMLDMQEHRVVQPFIRISEQAQAQQLTNAQQEQVEVSANTPAGIAQDDFDEGLA